VTLNEDGSTECSSGSCPVDAGCFSPSNSSARLNNSSFYDINSSSSSSSSSSSYSFISTAAYPQLSHKTHVENIQKLTTAGKPQGLVIYIIQILTDAEVIRENCFPKLENITRGCSVDNKTGVSLRYDIRQNMIYDYDTI